MAHSVSITYGSTTLNLYLVDYTPTSAPASQATVEERWEVNLSGATSADLVAAFHALDRAFAQARQRQIDGHSDRVYLNLLPKDLTVNQHSEIIQGRIEYYNETLRYAWANKAVDVRIVVERRNYWEPEDPITLELSNGAVADQTAAPIGNCQDGAHDLYVEIDADQVTGVLPTPAILEITNTLNDASLVDNLLVGAFAAEGATAPPAPGTLVCEGGGEVDAICSGGEYAALSWVDAAENELTSWVLASGPFQQKTYRAVARLQAAVAYEDLWLKAKLLAGATVIAETRWMLVDAGRELVAIGSLVIPPYALGETLDLGDLTLALYEKRAGGGGALNLDYLILLPQDSWRRYGAISGLAYDETLVDDPVRGVLVTDYGVGLHKVTHKIDTGLPIMLRPGVKNVLYFLQDEVDGAAPIGRTASVTIKAYPRRLAL